MNKFLTALFGAVFLLATFFGGSRTADLQAEIAALREAVERPEVVKEEVIVEIEKPVTIVKEVPKVIEVVKETIREIEIIREIEVKPEPEEPEEVKPEEPEPEEPRPDFENPTMISYCLMGSYPDGTFAYTFDGYIMTATLYYYYDAPPVEQKYDVFGLAVGNYNQGPLPVNPILSAHLDGGILYLELVGGPQDSKTIDLLPRGE